MAMAKTHHTHRPIAVSGGDRRAFPLLMLLLLFSTRCAAQPSSNANNSNSNSNGNSNSNNSNNPDFGSPSFSPSMAIVIVILVSAFFFLGFFSIYIRQCGGDSYDGAIRSGGSRAARSRRARGLDPAVLASFPTLVYSEVKVHKIGKDALECAVCLSEFEDDEELRLLPKCSHVFHPDCIDAWLANHVTCPVCRANLAADPNDPPAADLETPATASAVVPAPGTPALDPEPVAAVVDVPVQEGERRDQVEIDVDRHEEMIDLQRIASKRRAGDGATRSKRFSRSHSTGHSVALQPGENMDRFTLRLPDHVRREIIAAGRLRRTTSLLAFPTEGSSHRGYRGAGEGSSRGGRSIRLGRSDRWPSFLLRTFSAKFPAWGGNRRGAGDGEGSTRGRPPSPRGAGRNGDGSVKKSGADCEGSTRGRLASPWGTAKNGDGSVKKSGADGEGSTRGRLAFVPGWISGRKGAGASDGEGSVKKSAADGGCDGSNLACIAGDDCSSHLRVEV